MWLRCLTFSCHSAGTWRTRSRAETTTCTSASPSEARGAPHLERRRAREDLVADDRGAVPRRAPGSASGVPRADGLGLQPAPRQRHQVERGEEVGVEAVGRGRGCRARAAPPGCGRGRPGGRTCRSSGSPRAAAPACSPIHLPLCRGRVRHVVSATIRSPGPAPAGRRDRPAGRRATPQRRGARSARSPTTE